MYNAELVTRRSPGVSIEPRAYPESGPDIAHNYARMLPIAKAATELVHVQGRREGLVRGIHGLYLSQRTPDCARRPALDDSDVLPAGPQLP